MAFPIGFATGAGVPTNEEMDAAAAFGAKFIRCGVPWDNGSSAPDRNFNTPNAIVNAVAYANSIGLGVILQVGAGTTYNGMMYTHSGPGGFDVVVEYSKFCANVIRRFNGAPGTSNYVWAVEIGNETNHAKWNDLASPYFVPWTGAGVTGPDRYVETVLRIVHPAFENVRATAGCPQIITGGLGGESDAKGINSYAFTVAIHDDVTFGGVTYPGGLWSTTAGANPWYDGFNLHPYCYPTLPTADTSGGWANMEQIMSWFQTNRGTKPPLWITEFGQPTKPETLATCLAARDSMQDAFDDLTAKIAGQGWDVRSFAWFSMMNNNKVDDSGNDNYFGIVDRPATGTDPQNGAHKPRAALGGTGQLFDKFVEVATMSDYVVPTSIPTSAIGAPVARDVTVDLQTFFDTVPLTTGGRILFQPNKVYHVEGTIGLDGNQNLTIDGRGATVQAKLTKFYSGAVGTNGVVTGLTVGGPTWTIGSQQVKTVTGPPGTFTGYVKKSFLAWYVDAADCRARTQAGRPVPGQPDIPAPTDTVIHILADPADLPPNSSNKTLTFTSPDDRNRSQFTFDNCNNLVVQNLNIFGANPTFAGFKNETEQQSGLWLRGGCDGFEITGCEIHHVWGDCITIAPGANPLNRNGWVHNNHLHHSTRQTMTTQGLVDVLIENNNMHDGQRHIIDMEPNGGNQTCLRVTYRNNQMLRGNFGCLAISAYGYVPVFVGDIVFTGNTIDGNLNIPVGTNHNHPADQPRWGPFTFTNNTATLPHGTGAKPVGWVSGNAYAVGAQVTDGAATPDSFWQCKIAVTSTTRPALDLVHWRKISLWDNAPGMIKFQYCDGITVTGNRGPLQPGRLMYEVWAEFSTGVDVHSNHDQTPTDTFINPHFELFTDAFGGQATFNGGGTFGAVGHSVPSTRGSAQFQGGGTFGAVGKGRNKGTALIISGAIFSASGTGQSYGTASFDGGGTFSASGLSTNKGTGLLISGAIFTAVGTGKNYGTASFSAGGSFTAVGTGVNHGTATFDGGGSFSTVGVGQNFGLAHFSGGGEFTAVGLGKNYATAQFQGGGTFTTVGTTPIYGTAQFDGGGTFTLTGHTDDDEDRDDGRWRAGAVALRGPGWDETGWDSDAWGGLG